jgi:Cu-Zn family superoxide dismutase
MRTTRTSRSLAALALFGASLAVLPGTAATAVDTSSGRVAHAVVRNAAGTVLGTIEFRQSRGRITVGGRLNGLTAGFHGFHVHAVGICNPTATDPTGAVVPFFTAGAHLNPGGATHGHHAGDLSLLYVAADGTTVTVTDNDQLTAANLFDADGSAVIVHAAPDNYANIPPRYSAAGVPGPDAATLGTGDSGGRTACGVLAAR